MNLKLEIGTIGTIKELEKLKEKIKLKTYTIYH